MVALAGLTGWPRRELRGLTPAEFADYLRAAEAVERWKHGA